MRTKRFLARVETLESREVMSSLSFAGSGTGTVVARAPIPTGSYETFTILKGTSKSLGAFTGALVTDFATDQFHVTRGYVFFTNAAGSSVLGKVTGSYTKPRHGLTHVSGNLAFDVVLGSGTLAHAAGHGTIHISQNVENEKLKFTLAGQGTP